MAGCSQDDPVPPAQADGLTAYPGKNRAKLEWTVPSDAVSSRVFFNSGDVLEVPVTDHKSTQNVIVEPLAEGDQTLRVVTLNAGGQHSSPRGIVVKVFGDAYQNGLTTRKFLLDQSSIESTSAQLAFGEAAEGEIGVRIVYTNTSGAKDSVMMSSSERSKTISNIDTEQPYHHYSLYKPVADAIDEFSSSKVNTFEAQMFDFEKDKWTATVSSYPQWDPSMLPENAIDNDINTQWHSNPWDPPSTLPQWLQVDMQREKKISGFYFVQSQTESSNGLAKNFVFEVSTDGTNWTVVKESEVTTSLVRQGFEFDRQVTARYFKITILAGQDPNVYWSQIAEIDLYNEIGASGLNAAIELVNVPLINAQPPFAFEPTGNENYGRWSGWTHSNNIEYSYVVPDWGARPVLGGGDGWGVPFVTNGKLHQTLNLEAGDYILQIDCSHMDGLNDPNVDLGSVEAYGVAAKGSALPDITAVASASETLGSQRLVPSGYNGHNVNEIPFTAPAGQVTVGFVFTALDNGHGWGCFTINGIKLVKITQQTK